MSRNSKQRRKQRRKRIADAKLQKEAVMAAKIEEGKKPLDYEKLAYKFSNLTFRGGTKMVILPSRDLVDATSPEELKKKSKRLKLV